MNQLGDVLINGSQLNNNDIHGGTITGAFLSNITLTLNEHQTIDIVMDNGKIEHITGGDLLHTVRSLNKIKNIYPEVFV